MSVDLGSIVPDRIRSISMLGSTTSTTVCNSQTTGNIVLVAAGGNGRKGLAFGCSNGMNFRFTAEMPRSMAS